MELQLLPLFRGPREGIIPTKIVRMVQVMYTICICAVVDGDGRTDWFAVRSGVKQGCNMSGFLFLLVTVVGDEEVSRKRKERGLVEDDNYARGLRFCRRLGSHLKYIHASSDED